ERPLPRGEDLVRGGAPRGGDPLPGSRGALQVAGGLVGRARTVPRVGGVLEPDASPVGQRVLREGVRRRFPRLRRLVPRARDCVVGASLVPRDGTLLPDARADEDAGGLRPGVGGVAPLLPVLELGRGADEGERVFAALRGEIALVLVGALCLLLRGL